MTSQTRVCEIIVLYYDKMKRARDRTQASISSYFVSKEKKTQSEEDEVPHSTIDEAGGDEEREDRGEDVIGDEPTMAE